MILIYPALVSSTIPPEFMPAICKLLERYLIVYVLDDQIEKAKRVTMDKALKNFQEGYIFDNFKANILNETNYRGEISGQKSNIEPPNNDIAGEIKNRAQMHKIDLELDKLEKDLADHKMQIEREKAKLRMQGKLTAAQIRKLDSENNDYYNQIEREKAKLRQAGKKINSDIDLANKKYNLDKTRAKIESDKYKEQLVKDKYERLKAEREKKSIKVSSITLSSEMSLEPTNIQINTLEGETLIGIKVVPFYVSEKSKLAELLLSDRYVSGFKKAMLITTRNIKKSLLHVFYDTLKYMPFFPKISSTLTGDVNKDVLFSMTNFKDRVMCVVDINELQDSNEFFSKAGGIKQLFKLGWNNLVFVDDINKRVHFCMKKFNGLCSVIPYSTMYSSLGSREQLYNSIESARTASNPFFSVKRSISMFENTKTNEYLNTKLKTYKSLNEQSELLDESFISDAIDKLSSSKFMTKLKDIIEKKDVDKLISLSKKIIPENKNLDPESARKIASNKFEKFDECYNLSYKVINNSLEDFKDDYLKKMISNFISVSAIGLSLKNKTNAIFETKELLKKVVPKLNGFDLSDTTAVNNLLKLFFGIIVPITFGSLMFVFPWALPATAVVIAVVFMAAIYAYSKNTKKESV